MISEGPHMAWETTTLFTHKLLTMALGKVSSSAWEWTTLRIPIKKMHKSSACPNKKDRFWVFKRHLNVRIQHNLTEYMAWGWYSLINESYGWYSRKPPVFSRAFPGKRILDARCGIEVSSRRRVRQQASGAPGKQLPKNPKDVLRLFDLRCGGAWWFDRCGGATNQWLVTIVVNKLVNRC